MSNHARVLGGGGGQICGCSHNDGEMMIVVANHRLGMGEAGQSGGSLEILV